MVEASKFRDDENTRPCPTCRMPVSVLAVKCRFCGAEMGRPKEAGRNLTVEDLGGETVVHYAPSSNVMDALEAFRNEENSNHNEEAAANQGTLFGRKSKKVAKGDELNANMRAQDLPELDERSRALASIAMPRKSPRTSSKVQRYTTQDYVRYGLVGLGVLVVLYLAVFQAPGWIEAMRAKPKNTFSSSYPALVEQGAPPLKLLSAAVEAVNAKPDDAQFQQDAAEARQKVIADVQGILNRKDFSRDNLSEASTMANKASDIDPNPKIQQLKVSVDDESRAYNTFLKSIDAAKKQASFTVVDPKNPDSSETASVGDLVAGRFKIVSIVPNGVRVEDVKRGNRTLTARPGGRFE